MPGLPRAGRCPMRVSAGELRGRRLHAPPGRATRPTTERARAGLFDWLGTCVAGARVLDLFAGSGALGIEALSRGALEVVFVERARGALRALSRNCRELGLEEQARVLAASAPEALSQLRAEASRFDLVLADPPYQEEDLWEGVAGSPQLPGLLAPGSVLVLERSARAGPAPAPPGLICRASKRYGETAFDWYETEESSE